MSDREAARPLSIRILDKEYFIGAAPEERSALMESAELLNRRMREIRDGGKIVGTDRIAVIAALNLAHELLASRRQTQPDSGPLSARINSLRERIESALQSGARSHI